ncbi:MAG: DUF2971 domain-containing protein [Fibromonadales bacterium]|nr:DUF2971 domain-containing protein [Fibromonadales bacterium]
MITIEEVVYKWNKTCSHKKIENQESPNVTFGKIYQNDFGKQATKEAVIKLSEKYPHIDWHLRTCYVLSFNFNRQTHELINIYIGFERRVRRDSNTQKIYKSLSDEFNNKYIGNKKMILSRGRIYPDHLVLRMELDLNLNAEKICKCIDEFIDETQEQISSFLTKTNSNNKEISHAQEETINKNEKEMLCGILKMHGIDEKIELFKECEKIYSCVRKIVDSLFVTFVDYEDADELEVSHYTKKSTAYKLFSKCPSDKFRLYDPFEMNDPNEGKTLLSFLKIETETELELPERIAFIASFSSNVNSLNQFRLYGKENDKEATGISILFEPSFFSDVTPYDSGEKYPLYRCVYVNPDSGKIESISLKRKKKCKTSYEQFYMNEKFKERVEGLFEKLKIAIEDLLNFKINESINKTKLIEDLLIDIRYLVKDYAFTEEQECRIIDKKNKDESIIVQGERLCIESVKLTPKYIPKIYFAPLAEGMAAFEIESGIKCIRSRHPYRNKTQEKSNDFSTNEFQVILLESKQKRRFFMNSNSNTPSIWDGNVDDTWPSTFTITTPQQLAKLAELVNAGNDFSGKTVKLGADIILNDTVNLENWSTIPPKNEWIPIGTDGHSFNGIFDGMGHTISGVYIKNSKDNQGLFGCIRYAREATPYRGTIKNLKVVDSYVEGNDYVGGIVGYKGNGTMVSDCCFSGKVAGRNMVGGLAGNNRGEIIFSYFAGTVTGQKSVNDLIGTNNGEIHGCNFTGTVNKL